MFRVKIHTHPYSSEKKFGSSVLLRGLVAAVAGFFVFAPVLLAICAPNPTPSQLVSVQASLVASDAPHNAQIHIPSNISRWNAHCALLGLIQFSDGILPSDSKLSQVSWNSVLWETQNVSFKNSSLHIYALGVSDSYRYKANTLLNQSVLLRV